jgi:hypothetical protein
MISSNARVTFIEKFIAHFQPAFSKIQLAVFKNFIYAMFPDYKRLSLCALSNKLRISYQNLQYFFSDSNWDIEQLNNIRVNLIQNQKPTASTPNGVMAIDDSASPKPYAKKTEGAQVQYCGPSAEKVNCNVAVASCFVSAKKHFPINFKPYIPIDQSAPNTFKNKIGLAKELISDAIHKNIAFSSIVFDSWYTAADMLEFIDSKSLHFAAEVKSNRSIRITHPQSKVWQYLKASDIIPLIKKFYPHKLKSVNIPQKNGKHKDLLTYTFQSKLKNCSAPIQVVFIFNKWSDKDDKNYHVLITNKLNMPAKEIILTYLLRWGIEESFRELKDSFCFDQYQVRHQEQIRRHWIMSFLAWSLAYWAKQKGCLSKILDLPANSINQTKEAIASLIIIDSAFLLSKNENLKTSLSNIKSERFIKQLRRP